MLCGIVEITCWEQRTWTHKNCIHFCSQFVKGVCRNDAGLLACSNHEYVIKPEKQDSNLAQIVKQLKWASQTVNRHGGSLLSQWVFTSDNKNSKKFISHSWFAKISISFWMRVWFSENMIFYNFSIITFKNKITNDDCTWLLEFDLPIKCFDALFQSTKMHSNQLRSKTRWNCIKISCGTNWSINALFETRRKFKLIEFKVICFRMVSSLTSCNWNDNFCQS